MERNHTTKKLSSHSSIASDYQYDEEKHERLFMMSQADEVREKVLKRHLKHRLPRKPGMYELPTRKRSVQTAQSHYYEGNHWDVHGTKPTYEDAADDDVDADETQAEAPLSMERTTRRLTIHAVNEAVDEEQLRRIKKESHDIKRAAAILGPMNKELKVVVHRSKKEEKKKEKEMVRKVEEKHDTVLEELLHKKHLVELAEEEEEEKQRRIKRMEDLTDYDKAEGDPELLAAVKDMSTTAKTWNQVGQELKGAFHDLEEMHDEVDQAVDDLYSELKDDFVQSFKRTTHLMQLHALEESERRRRVSDIQEVVEAPEADTLKARAMDAKDRTHEELARTVATIIRVENEKEEIGKETTKVHMVGALEELLHVQNGKMADDACAEERKRRIQEAEEELNTHAQPDPVKERVRDSWRTVQEHMLTAKFHGKKKNVHEMTRNFDKPSVDESANDKKLRQLRTNARRPSCVLGLLDN